MEKQDQTLFGAINILNYEQDNTHQIIATAASGKPLFAFEISPQIAKELSKKMDLQIITVKKQKSWQDDQEDAGAPGKAAALQLNGSTTLQEEAPGYE